MAVAKHLKADLTIHWIITGIMLSMLIAYNIIGQTSIALELNINVAYEQRLVLRSVFYAIAIILFPIANLLRHILLRLNQTMPGNNPAKNRYLVTIIVTMVLVEIVGLFGFIMHIMGDNINTLYIFSALALLGIFLHRPRVAEYEGIIEAMRVQDL